MKSVCKTSYIKQLPRKNREYIYLDSSCIFKNFRMSSIITLFCEGDCYG